MKSHVTSIFKRKAHAALLLLLLLNISLQAQIVRYVNDLSTAGDVYTTAIGSNSNPGTAAAPYLTIAFAIARASNGDTIKVDVGTYTENVFVSKSVHLKGANFGKSCETASDRALRGPETIINGAFQTGNGTTAPANVLVDGFKFIGSNVTFTDRVRLSVVNGINTVVTNNYFDSELPSATNYIVSGKSVLGMVIGTGFNHTGLVISKNYFARFRTGIFSNPNTSVTTLISNNQFTCRTGINFDHTGSYIYRGTVTDNNFTEEIFGTDTVGAITAIAFARLKTGSDMTFLRNRILHNFVGVDLKIVESGVALNFANNFFDKRPSASGVGSHILIQSYPDSSGLVFNGNSFEGVGSGYAIANIGGRVSATCSWFGSSDPAVVVSRISGTVTFVNFLVSGVDDQPSVYGFQSQPGTCTGCVPFTWYLDADGDTYYVATQSSCNHPGVGWTTVVPSGGLGDCNDADQTRHATFSFYTDTDLDGFGAGSLQSGICAVDSLTPPSGYSLNNLDCNNNNATLTLVCAGIQGPDTSCLSAYNDYTLVGDTSNSTVFTWSISPSSGASVLGSSPLTRRVRIITPGTYVLSCKPNLRATAYTKTIVVPANPSSGIINGPTSVCENGTAVYTVTNATGSYGFVWSSTTGATLLSSSGNTATFQFPGVAQHRIRVLGYNGSCASSNFRNYTVNTVAAPTGGSISGDLTTCSNSTLTYGVSGVNNATAYQWSVNNGASISGSGTTVNVTFVNAGNTTVSVVPVNGSGCAASPINALIAVSAGTPANSAILIGSAKACTNSIEGYKASVASAYTWSIASGGGTILNGQGTDSVTISFNGTYPLAANPVVLTAVPSGCNATGINRTVTVYQTPDFPTLTLSPDSACTGANVVCSASATNATYYNWNIIYAASNSGGTASSIHVTMANRNVVVRVIPRNAECMGPQDSKTIIYQTTDCSRLEEQTLSNGPTLKLYPNPTKDKVYLKLEGIDEGLSSMVSIFDLQGRMMMRWNDLVLRNLEEMMLPISTLVPGMYQVQVLNGNNPFNARLLVE